MTALAFVGAAIIAALGAMHLAYTLQDFGARPRHFTPTDPVLLTAMRQCRTALAPHGRDYWSGILGFHLSHSMGLAFFALLGALAGPYEIEWLKPLLILAGLAYAAISFRCWFAAPTICVLLATALMAAGWWL
jgi:hypothetical protein